MPPDFTAHLTDRKLIRIFGEDAETFLHNIVTNDIRGLKADELRYACLLTPQGQYLHDFFITAGDSGHGFLLDCEAARLSDLLQRLAMFRLRSRVTFEEVPRIDVYYATVAGDGYPDPRRPGLGYRIYAEAKIDAEPVARYYDFSVEQGLPCGSLTMKPGKETMADVNLDILNAVSWDKGCFVGQEVAARMHNRGLTKRRLFVVTGRDLNPGMLRHGDSEAGEIRQVNSTGDKALAVIKLAAASQKGVELISEQGTPVRLAEANAV